MRAACLAFRVMTPLFGMDRATFEREFRACIHRYLDRQISAEDSRAVLLYSEALTASYAAVVGLQEAQRVASQLLERVANVFVPLPQAG